MNVEQFLSYALAAAAGLLVLYVAVRVTSAAFFRSKQDFERTRDGQSTQPRR